MIVYRIAKKKSRANDLSGQGAANEGGRWNSQDVYALYTSESRALALLEVLVHVDLEDLPDNMFVMVIEIDDLAPVYHLDSNSFPSNWRDADDLQLRTIGDKLINEAHYLAFKVPSAVIPAEYNFILNPRHPDFGKWVTIKSIEDLVPDPRLGRGHV